MAELKSSKVYGDLTVIKNIKSFGAIEDNKGNILSQKASKDGLLQTNLNADLLDGKHASNFALATHSTNTSNPHGVTVSQIGAETPTGAQAKADTAESNANTYTDTKITEVNNSLKPSSNISLVYIGIAAPDPVNYRVWIDTSNATALFKYYDGASWIAIGTYQ